MANLKGDDQEDQNIDSTLAGFNWDDKTDFFGIKGEESSTTKQERIIKEVKEEIPPSVGKKKNTVEKEEEEEEEDDIEGKHTFFEDETSKGKDKDIEGKGTKDKKPEDDEVEEITKSKTKPLPTDKGDKPEDDDVSFFTTLSKELKDKGIFSNIEIKDDDEIDEDKFFELHEQEIDKRVDEVFDSFTTELPEDAKAFVKFLRDGGNTYDFLTTYRESTRLPDGLEFEEGKKGLANADKVLRWYYKNIEELDDIPDEETKISEIDEKLEWVKDRNKTLELAAKYYKKINDADRKEKEALIKQQEEQQTKAKERNEKLKVNLSKIIDKGEGEGDIVFTTKDTSLVNMITKPTVKVGPNRYLTELQAKLSEIMKDEKKLLTLAKIVKDDFKLPAAEKKIENKIVKSVQSKLKDTKNNIKTGGGSNRSENALADFFS